MITVRHNPVPDRPIPDRPDYTKVCRQTVTLYNVVDAPDGDKIYHKTVFEKSAFLEGKRTYPTGPTGVSAQTSGLLVIPANPGFAYPGEFKSLPDKSGRWTVQRADKAVPGVGPDVADSGGWAAIKEENFPGCVTVGAVEYHSTLTGELAHIQATP